MKITKLEVWPVHMRLAEPYTIAYQTVYGTTNVFLRMETNAGICGYGCAAPDEHITGETAESVQAILQDVVTPSVMGSDPLRPAMILERLNPHMTLQPSARAAVDMAIYDLLGKVSNLPLWKLLGGFRSRIKTSITIGIVPVKETIERASD
ncbi:MAG: dipeptide epimerase, partial [Deltaproteobacteria bacterium]